MSRVDAVLVDEIVIDLGSEPPIVSLRCGAQEFGWHEVEATHWDLRDYVVRLAQEYGTRVVEVNVGPRSLPEFVERWITGPLAELGFAIREIGIPVDNVAPGIMRRDGGFPHGER